MMKLFIKLIAATTLLTSTLAQAKIESWYTFWGAGVANISYSGERKEEINFLTQKDGDSTGIHANALGFYFPIDNNSIYGFVIDAATTSYNTDNISFIDSVSYSDSMLAFSYMNFYGSEIGDGLFYRADIGYNRAFRTIEYSFNDNESSQDEYEFGTGASVLLAAGYGIPVSEESRVLVSLEFRNSFVDNNEMQSIGLTVNGLW
jgi:hypothetical protein